LRKATILVIDDNRDAATTLCMLLELMGHSVRIGHTGPDAIQLADELRPDIVLLDLGMPGMDGYELMRTIRALPPEKGGRVPAATLTARAVTDDRLESLKAGFQSHLAKPIEPAELVEVVAVLAGRR